MPRPVSATPITRYMPGVRSWSAKRSRTYSAETSWAAGGDGDHPAFIAQGLGGVLHEIDKDVAQLAGVAGDGGQVRRQIQFQPSPGRDHALEMVELALDERRDIDPLVHPEPRPRVGEHLPGERGGPMRGLDDLSQIVAGRIRGRQFGQRQFSVAHDGGQKVVEVVGDPAGEHRQSSRASGPAGLGVPAADAPARPARAR